MPVPPAPAPAPASRAATLRGTWLLVLSAIAFSTAGFFTREAPVDLWAMIFWRNLFGGLVLAATLLARPRLRGTRAWQVGWREWGVMGTASLGTIAYIGALTHTSVADVSIIYATAPILAAALAWFVRRERMSSRTLAGALAALVGVGVTMAGALASGTLLGDALALAMTLSLSAMAVLMRGSTLPAPAAALGSALLTVVVVLPVGWAAGSGFSVDAASAGWLALFGAVTIGVAMPSYLAGAATVASGRAMLISTLELPLAPLWVWLAFGETPTLVATVGGAIVLVAVLADNGPPARPPACEPLSDAC